MLVRAESTAVLPEDLCSISRTHTGQLLPRKPCLLLAPTHVTHKQVSKTFKNTENKKPSTNQEYQRVQTPVYKSSTPLHAPEQEWGLRTACTTEQALAPFQKDTLGHVSHLDWELCEGLSPDSLVMRISMHPPNYPYYKETFEGGELFWGNLKTMNPSLVL